MDALECCKGLAQHGYQRLSAGIKDVEIFRYEQSGTMTGLGGQTVAVVNERLGACVDTWQMMNLKNAIAQAIGTFDVLFVVFTADAQTTRAHLAGDHSHWLYDVHTDRLLIYEDQPVARDGLEELLQEMASAGPRRRGTMVQGPEWNGILTVSNLMVFLNLAVYLVGELLYYRKGIDLRDWGELISHRHGEYYRFFTCMFLHADIAHIAGNMVTLFFIGASLEKAVGHVKFAVIYLVGGLVGSVVQYIYYGLVNVDAVRMLGASGAIFAVIGAYVYVLIRNRRRIERTAIPRFIIYILLSIYVGVTSTNISVSAHIGGMVGGFILAVILYHGPNVRHGRKQTA